MKYLTSRGTISGQIKPCTLLKQCLRIYYSRRGSYYKILYNSSSKGKLLNPTKEKKGFL